MGYQAPCIFDVGAEVADCISSGDEPSAIRLAFRFVEIFERAPTGDRPVLVVNPPASSGDARYDALLAAVTEYSCARGGLVPPNWVDDSSRFLSTWWFVSNLHSLHADAIAHSPISFARRGVFITTGALTYA
jgi:hypothetical protein